MKDSCIDIEKSTVHNLVVLGKEIRVAFGAFADANFPKELGQEESRVVSYVCHHPGALAVEIANDFHLVKSTVSGIVNSLIEKGYVRAENSEKDKRKNHLYPSEKALAMEAEVGKLFDVFDHALVEGISEEEQKLFIDICQKIERNSKEVIK